MQAAQANAVGLFAVAMDIRTVAVDHAAVVSLGERTGLCRLDAELVTLDRRLGIAATGNVAP